MNNMSNIIKDLSHCHQY